MKRSSLILDITAGDASREHVEFVNECQKLNIPLAYFEYANILDKIDDEDYEFSDAVLEAAADNAVPVTANKAAVGDLSCESARESISQFLNVIISMAKSVKEVVDKDMKLMVGIAKSAGINYSLEGSSFVTGFAEPVAKHVVQSYGAKKLGGKVTGNVDLTGHIIKARNARSFAMSYAKGMADYLSAYDISLKNVINDPTITDHLGMSLGKIQMSKVEGWDAKKSQVQLRAIASNIEDGTAKMKLKEVDGNIYTNKASEADITEFIVALRVIEIVSDEVLKQCDGARKATVLKSIERYCVEGSGRKNSSDFKPIIAAIKSAKETCTYVESKCAKAFNDSTHALSSVK